MDYMTTKKAGPNSIEAQQEQLRMQMRSQTDLTDGDTMSSALLKQRFDRASNLTKDD